MKKRIAALLLCLALLFPTGCTGRGLRRWQTTYLDLFDTVTIITGYAATQTEFTRTADALHDALAEYHRLYDIYHTYAGVTNLCDLNKQAGGEALPVDPRILDLLDFSRTMYEATDGAVNIALGSVLRLWHDARENTVLPDPDALSAAAAHTDFAALELDFDAGTARISDPAVQLDVGAVAKGYATEQIARAFTDQAGYILSVGGNVRALGASPDGDWSVGLEDPFGEGLRCTVGIQDAAVVTSGSYQRFFTVDGVDYHHIIDPATNYPARSCTAVTILAQDAGVADALSTALFILPQEQGQEILNAFPGAEALWIFPDGSEAMSPGFAAYLR